MELSEIKSGTLFYDIHAVVDQKSTNTTKTGKLYADITLKAGNCSLKCKKWSYNAEKYDGLLAPGKTVKVAGEASLYLGELQATLNTVESSERSPDEFARRTKFDVEAIYVKILAIVNSFQEDLPKYIAKELLTKYKKEFQTCPAALGVHQAWFGGLIEHTYNMLNLALPIINYYQNEYGIKSFSRDKVLFGVVMHDFGKIFEYDCSSPAFKMRPEGVLLNHIMRGSLLIHDTANYWYEKVVPPHPGGILVRNEFERERDILVHLIASHHGKHEFGSPQLPSCLEAVLLHYIDMIDSHMMPAVELVEGKPGQIDGFSERCRIEKAQYIQN